MKFGLESLVPSVHSIDLVLVLALTGALGKVALGPLAVTSGDLLDTHGGVLAVVSVNVVKVTSFTVIRWTTVWELVIIEAASLVATLEVALHTVGIVCELLFPGVDRGNEAEPLVENLDGEFGQAGQSVKWMPWWNLLVLGGDGNGKKSKRKFHF